MYIETSYLLYLMISTTLTVWVARTLSKNGLVFLIDSFNGNEQLAHSVNHLLVVGFYLLNLGYILLALQTQDELSSLRHSIEFISKKVGLAMFVLGAFHFFNVFIISKWRRKAVQKHSGQPEPKKPKKDVWAS
ncbi:hypothetical protein QSV34_13940 [Porticoccus sp. W117]|uniref:hypothetical protein n=1 Tax=Porticoccus sp. W117 TaxID=3054777 RepID=UPI0025990BC4|nr:hypothetical protein [Porticoccus sp. W117]MDM3872449.1 hypothetical protein [Porticoccus sp. W117]